jgi:LysM repeat protein
LTANLTPVHWVSSHVRRQIRILTDTVQQLRHKTQKLVRNFRPLTNRLIAALGALPDRFEPFFKLPRVKKIRKFIRAYSTQLGFGSFILIFLTFSVGEGQAYDADSFTTNIADELVQAEAAGFVGKPQVIGQTVLTGETQYAITYTVEPGDSLLSIAKRYNTNVNTIIEANDIQTANIEKIKPGTELVIPSQDSENSLAWLDDLNKLKEEEREAARQAELKRLAQQRRNSASFSRLPQIASTIGGISIVGVFRNLPTYTAYRCQCTQWALHNRPDLQHRRMGNGGQYLSFARSYGIATSKNPAVGALIVTNEARGTGHVGVVKGYTDSTVTVSDMNYVGPCVVSLRTISRSSAVIKGYVLW